MDNIEEFPEYVDPTERDNNFNDRERVGEDERDIGQTNFRDRIYGSEIDKLNERIKSDYNKLNEQGLVSESMAFNSISELCKNIDKPELKHAMTLAISAMIYLEENEGVSDYKDKIFAYVEKNPKFPTSKEDIFRYYKLFKN